MTRFSEWDERTLDLSVERYTVGLDRADEAVLDELADPADLADFERAVAAVHLGLLDDLEQPPQEFLARLEREGCELVGASPPTDAAPGPSGVLAGRVIAWAGWLAAAVLLLALLPLGAGGGDAHTRRAALLADATDLVRADWTASDDEAVVGASGDVVWSSDRQEGYMLFRGLAPNDHAENQYQLWIFDPTRADWEAKPVDGGVFDVTDAGEVVVPIDAKLAVSEAVLFGVTVEVPGGVVVSERERLVLTAAL